MIIIHISPEDGLIVFSDDEEGDDEFIEVLTEKVSTAAYNAYCECMGIGEERH